MPSFSATEGAANCEAETIRSMPRAAASVPSNHGGKRSVAIDLRARRLPLTARFSSPQFDCSHSWTLSPAGTNARPRSAAQAPKSGAALTTTSCPRALRAHASASRGWTSPREPMAASRTFIGKGRRSRGAQRIDDLEARGAHARQEPAHQPHEHRKGERDRDDLRREVEAEGELAEGLPVHGGDGEGLQEGGEHEPGDAADQREEDRLEQEGREDARAPEAERAQRADLAGAARHRRVHGDHRADHRADGEDHRERDAEDADELRQRLRLLLIKERLLLHIEDQALVGGDALEEGAEVARVLEAHDHRRVGGAPERLHHLLDVAPDLGVETRFAAVEHAHYRPLAPGEALLLADVHAVEAVGDAASDDDLGGAGAKHAPLV